MYFNGILEIDPSKMTVLKKVKPTKMFAKLVDVLTFGGKTEQFEHETFTAVNILQQLNMALRALKIKNVIRLAVDDYDFYLDSEGKDDDMKQAMLELETKIDPLESEVFKKIFIVLEHDDDFMKYLIEIDIIREHKPGEYPIKVKVNGLLADFKAKTDETREDIENKMKPIFESQDLYNQYILSRQEYFNRFLDSLAQAIRKYVVVDNVITKTKKEMVRPKQRIDSPDKIRTGSDVSPMYYGYHGIQDMMFYTMMWSMMCHSHHIYVHDTSIVDESGNGIMDVGEEGFDAGASDTLNEDAAFEAPAEGDVSYQEGSDFDGEIPAETTSDFAGDTGGDGSSWLDSFGGGDASDASSCSSCSSCGGCGGCS